MMNLLWDPRGAEIPAGASPSTTPREHGQDRRPVGPQPGSIGSRAGRGRHECPGHRAPAGAVGLGCRGFGKTVRACVRVCVCVSRSVMPDSL